VSESRLKVLDVALTQLAALTKRTKNIEQATREAQYEARQAEDRLKSHKAEMQDMCETVDNLTENFRSIPPALSKVPKEVEDQCRRFRDEAERQEKSRRMQEAVG